MKARIIPIIFLLSIAHNTTMPNVSGKYLHEAMKKLSGGWEEYFTHLYTTDGWNGRDACSGYSSSPEETKTVRKKLTELLKEYNVRTMVDLGCGPFDAWMNETDLSSLKLYIGIDIVDAVTQDNKKKYSNYTPPAFDAQHKTQEETKYIFMTMDATFDYLPRGDIIFCRDMLNHLNHTSIKAVIKLIKKSRSTYLLATSYTKPRPNWDLRAGRLWRSYNFEIAPFNFPKPLAVIAENTRIGCGDFSDKSLCLWKISDLPDYN